MASDIDLIFREGIPKLMPVRGLLDMPVKPDPLVFVLLEAQESQVFQSSSPQLPTIGYQPQSVKLVTRVGGNEVCLGVERQLLREEFDTYNFSSRVAPAGWRPVS